MTRTAITRYPITAYGVACGLGPETSDAARELAAGRRGLRPCPVDVPFDTVTGHLPADLPAPDPAFAAHDSRAVRIALLVYEEVRAATEHAVARWGKSRVGLIVSTSTGGIYETERACAHWFREGAFPAWYDYASQHRFHIFADVLRRKAGIEGPCYVVSTACSGAGKVFASARRLLDGGVCDAVLVGGLDALCHTTLRGFHSLGVLSPVACRPFGKDRPGMNIGEGAALCLLERSGEASVCFAGSGESSDAYTMSSPDPEGRGAVVAMRQALAEASIDADEIDHLNAHGTGTERNDIAEAQAVEAVFGRRVPVASTKGYTGHLLGAGGAAEAVFSILSLERGFLPASVGADPPDPDIHISLVRATTSLACRYVMSNSFAFGGSNVSLIFARTT